MPPIMLLGGVSLNAEHAGAQQLQAYAEHLGLSRVQVFWATLAGGKQTYLVVEWPHPVFENSNSHCVQAYLDTLCP